MAANYRLGIIARADDTGLGNQCREAARHLDPEKVLIVDLCHLSPKKLTLHGDWYPNAAVCHGIPDAQTLENFVQGLDIIYTAETPYNYELFRIAEEHGVKTVLHMNPEFNDYYLDSTLSRPTLFAAPTHWLYDSVPEPKMILPVPVAFREDTSAIPPSEPARFLHVVGNPAIHDRAGTKDLLAALPYITETCTVTLRCQDPGYVSELISVNWVPKSSSVTLVIDSSTTENYWDLYPGHDVLIHPRRFGGLNLPAQEALAAGLVVLMPRISPNDDLLPGDWLFPAETYGKFMARQPIDLYRTDPRVLAGMINKFADISYLEAEQAKVHLYADPLSWEVQKTFYDSIFENIVAGNIPRLESLS